MMKPLMLMRKKGMMGPFFTKHAGCNVLSKSVGAFYDVNSIPTTAPIASGTYDPPDGYVGVRYSYATRSLFTGGRPQSYALVGTLPDGLTLNESSGVITGYPTTEESLVTSSITAINVVGQDTTNSADIDITIAALSVVSYEAIQNETPSGSKILRSQVVKVTFNQPVFVVDTTGTSINVNGANQIISVSGSGTAVLTYTLQRAIYKHDITWSYSAGNITAVASGTTLGDVTNAPVVNSLPVFTVWDYATGETGGFNDTTWDADETRFDEEP